MDRDKDNVKTRHADDIAGDLPAGSAELRVLLVHQSMDQPNVETSSTLTAAGAVLLLALCAGPLYAMMAVVARRLAQSEDYVRRLRLC